MINVEGLTKQYGQVRAVNDLSFEVKPGVVTGFLGPNGAGKSTTMRLILGLDNPTAGHATIEGKHYRSLKNPLTKVGALLDAKATHPNRSAANHLKWIAQANGLPTKRVDEVLALVGLTDVAKKNAGGFSLGMGQRLGLAAALLGDPEYLILDEPVNGLDPEGIHWVRTLLQNLAKQGRTVLVSSHLLSEMAQTAEHLIVIGRGQLVADMPMQEFVRAHSASTVVVRAVDAAALVTALNSAGISYTMGLDALGREAFTINDTSSDDIGRLAFDQGIGLLELSETRASLEEAFLETTGEAVQYQAGGFSKE
ncbi:ABC transporter ATP-binding protein [Corynebacterium suranareeae]|uniref:ABC transporter ATP-binding protein n=1 Tax=Corynebacterium suranareeae TaxID=2506452 RepID=A0A160PTK9_9CORY|nr:ABC transporter ATP-binding protein [Corynebacterium suranareeae]BAU97105.1 ABC transporter ATP-binding protein [Corynebacterium suranareeae]